MRPEDNPMIRYDFAGKVALVTGSSRGIGAAILEGFARAGATCVLHYFDDPSGDNRKDAERHAEKLRNLRVAVHVLAADVRSSAQVETLMAQVKELTGGIDILVNNAGVLRDRSLRKMTLDDWRAVMDTNLDGVFHCCKSALDLLRDNGRVVNIASIAGLFPFHGQSNYAAAKAGVIALTKVLAKELAKRGITANAVAPGVIQTTMLGDLKPEVLEGYLKQIPLGRLGKPEDVANAVLFLASEESGYITGQVLPVTGGWF
jgi:3-oxoacyl-[acyl-carrier protein] reductase